MNHGLRGVTQGKFPGLSRSALGLSTLVALLPLSAAAAPSNVVSPSSAPSETPENPPVSSPASPKEGPTLERVTLEAAIARALQHNPVAQVAALEIERADSLIRQARAGSLPNLTGNATLTHLDSDRVMTTGNTSRVVAAQNQLGASLLLQVPLLAPSRWAQWSHAKESRAIVAESSSDTRRQLAIGVARAYLAVVTQHRVIEVAERAVQVSRAHDDYAKTRFKGGVGNQLDAVRSSQQLATNVALLERSQMGLVRATEALGVLLGEARPVDVVAEFELSRSASARDDEAALARRQDVSIARARRGLAERVSKDSWLDYLPVIVGQFQPFYQTPATLTLPQTGWQALLVLSLPLYDGGARYGVAREREVLKEQSEVQLQALLRQCRSEIRLAVDAVRYAESALAAARDAAALAKQAESMALLAYQAGATTNLEVIDAERRTRDAESDVLVAEDSVRQAKLDLLVASGKFPSSN